MHPNRNSALCTLWIISNISSVISVSIPIVYWTVLSKPLEHTTFSSISGHLLLGILTLIDTLVGSKRPCKLSHSLHTLAYGLLYAMFTIVYFLCGGDNYVQEPYIYKMIDWRDPARSFAAIFCLNVLFIIVHCIIWSICKANDNLLSMKRKIFQKQNTHNFEQMTFFSRPIALPLSDDEFELPHLSLSI